MDNTNYNDEPVLYCANCLSLKLLRLCGQHDCYCGECASVDVKSSSIEEWERLYKERYKMSFLDKK